MKTIFNAIRKHFAHKPHGFREEHPQRRSLANLERGLRGFANKLDTLTGLKPLTDDGDILLQRKLRAALTNTLQELRVNESRFKEAQRVCMGGWSREPLLELAPILELKDETGYLCATALALFRKTSGTNPLETRHGRGPTFQAKIGPITYTPGKLSFSLEIKFFVPGPEKFHSYTEGPFFIDGADLDSLGGAATALGQIEGILWKCLLDAPKSADFQSAQAADTRRTVGARQRDERIRAAFKTLPASDQAYLASLASRNSLGRAPELSALFA